MAEWKKVIVSGSTANLSALQVDNLTSGQVVIGGGASNLSTTAINGTGNILATTGATGVSISGSFSGSFQGAFSGTATSASFATTASYAQNAAQVNSALAIGEGLGGGVSFNGSTPITLTVSGAAQLSDNKIVKWNNTDGKFVDTSLTDNGTVVSGASSIQLTGADSSLTGSFSGSFKGDGSGLTGLVSTLSVSGSTGNGSISLQTQALSIVGTSNEVETSMSGQTLTIGLPNDVTIGNNLSVTGNLTVNGTASFQNTENLLVSDRFVLFASGSTTTGDGGIVVQQATQNVGELFGYDSGVTRWGFTGSFSADSSAYTPEAYVAAVLDISAGHSDIAKYQKNGNIKIDSGDIWIYA